ncbi:MAG TPA: hypothetical protein VJT73_04125 [Polyangiaceae bacterium]|nr:hypothetical protein [Polyangiaceae bacterium]
MKKTANDDAGFLSKYAYPAGKVPLSSFELVHAQEVCDGFRRIAPTR